MGSSSPATALLPACDRSGAVGLLWRFWSDGELGHSLTGSGEHSGGEDSRRGDSTAKRWPELGFSDLSCETEVLRAQGCLGDVWGISLYARETRKRQAQDSLGLGWVLYAGEFDSSLWWLT